jgi:uncharacterized membrane protein YfcA
LASLVVFYGTWGAAVATLGLWSTVAGHWPIAVAMAAGSYFAGSTPMGGGTVGFPVLVLIFDFPVEVGRSFSLMVQSVGMVSASIYIVATRTPVAWRILLWAAAASAIGTPLGLVLVAPLVPPLAVKLIFGVIWCSFGLLHLLHLRAIDRCSGWGLGSARFDAIAGVGIGIVGGAGLVSITGVGIDMLLYVVVVAATRMDIRIAVPTSVILMAWNSVVGFGTELGRGTLPPEVWGHWLAAAPIVALGAPGGAWAVARLSRIKTLLICSALLVFQFVWLCIDQRVTGWPLALSLAGVAASCAFLHALFRFSARVHPHAGK